MVTVKDDHVVSLDYVLRLENDQVIDQSSEGEPLEFLQGHSQIIPGLEEALYGMEVGEEKDVVVTPTDAYGEYDPEGFEVMPRGAFPDDMELQQGLRLLVRDQNTGRPFEVTVSEVREDNVVLDFNHPLAGQTLHFHVQIADLRPATEEELEHGHVHGPDTH